MRTEQLQKAVRAELKNFIEAKDEKTINLADSVTVFAKGFFNYMTESSMVSDSVLVSSIGFSHALTCLPEFLKKDIGFSEELVENSHIEWMLKSELFAIRNTGQFEQLMFSNSKQDMDLYKKNLKNPERVEALKEMQKVLSS